MSGNFHNKQLIILDRDGVINFDSDNFIRSVDEFIFIPGSIEAIAALKKAGKTVVIVSNQSGIARGYLDLTELDRMHDKLALTLEYHGAAIDKIYYCPHGPDDNCQCRKPKPAMMFDVIKDFSLPASALLAIGDSIRDLQAAHSAGIDSILVRTGKGESSVKKIANQAAFFHGPICDDLAQAVQLILQQ